MQRLKKYIFLFFIITIAVAAKAQTVFKTPSGQKYHLASCRMVKNVSQEITINEAKESGLQPCKICKPQNIYGANAPAPHKDREKIVLFNVMDIQKLGTVVNTKQVLKMVIVISTSQDKVAAVIGNTIFLTRKFTAADNLSLRCY
jgi:hypothetical protein